MSLANLSESKGSKALHCCTIMAAGPVPVKTHSMSPWKAFAGQHRSSSHMTVYANRWFGLLNPIVPASVALADSTTTAFLASVALALAPPGDTGGMPGAPAFPSKRLAGCGTIPNGRTPGCMTGKPGAPN
mmetsp:Transcript_52998/g.109505  ORF Transcript_52998/g.109505 Transcript_52998/m.109505 type:complete len:130 (+) Transcript_52998:49-438(+)